MVGVRVSMQEGAVRHGRNGILPVLLDGHAALVDGWEHQICHCFGRCTVIKLVHRGVNRRVIKTTRYRATGAAARVLLVGLFRSSGTSGPVGQVPTAFLCSLELLPTCFTVISRHAPPWDRFATTLLLPCANF